MIQSDRRRPFVLGDGELVLLARAHEREILRQHRERGAPRPCFLEQPAGLPQVGGDVGDGIHLQGGGLHVSSP